MLRFSISLFPGGALTGVLAWEGHRRWLVCFYLSWCPGFVAKPGFMDPGLWHVLEMKPQREQVDVKPGLATVNAGTCHPWPTGDTLAYR